MANWVGKQVNYHSSFVYDGINGIIGLDKPVNFYSASRPGEVAGSMTLRYVMYNYLKMPDNRSLFAEIHQNGLFGTVQVVVPKTPEAERLVLMINKQPAVFFSHYLKDRDLDGPFVDALVNESVDASFRHTMDRCQWDAATLTITTPEDAQREKEQEIEAAAWYRDEYGSHMKSKDKQKKQKEYAAPEALYDMDDEHTFHTIHGGEGKGYAGTPGAAKINLGEGKDTKEIDVGDDDDSDNMSALSTLSRGELVALLRKHKISSTTGSGPDSTHSKSGSSSAGSEASQSSGSAASAPSSSSGESAGKKIPAGIG